MLNWPVRIQYGFRMEKEMKKFTKDEIEKDVNSMDVSQRSEEAGSNAGTDQEDTEANHAELNQEGTEAAANVEAKQEETEAAANAEVNQENTEAEANTEVKQESTKTDVNAKPNEEGLEEDNKEKEEGAESGNLKETGTNGKEGSDVKKGRKKGRIAAATLAVVFIIALAFIYGKGVYDYKRSFFPNLEVNGVSCGNLTLQEAADKVQQWYSDNYSLELLDGRGEALAVVLPPDVQMIFPVEEELSKILEEQDVYKWFIYIFSEECDTREIAVLPQYDMEKLQKLLEERGLFDVSRGEAPQDAYISEYQEELKQYVIVPEREGTVLEQEITIACAAEALAGMQDSLDLYETGCFQIAEITADDEQLKQRLEALNRVAGACITYDWNGRQEILDGELIHQWMVLDGEEITLDEEQVAAYVAHMAKEYDTYGKKRKFVTTSGLTLTLPSGAYGWRTDRNAETEALIELILSGAVTEREPIYTSQGWVKGEDDIGNSYVEINLTDQHLYLYIDGELILETDFVSGNVANGNSTPAGVFGLTYKTRNAVLRGPDYETPVNYWMPFNGNIGMHDATWRRSFGGDIYLTNGSHGCINLPLKMAKTIYGYMSAGFPVICYYY